MSQSLISAEFYISPKGNDKNPGTAQRPFASIPAARDAARAKGGTKHVIIMAAGRYANPGTITLDDRDSGLTIKGWKSGAATEIYGGIPITGWVPWKNGIWRAPVPKGTRFFNLIADGRSLTMAQTPNAGSGYGGGVIPDPEPGEGWKLREYVIVPEEFRAYDYSDAQIFAFHNTNWFSEMHAILAPPDRATGKMKVAKNNIGKRLFVRGVLEFLDEPGEWCLKHKEGFVYYWPKSGKPTDQVIIRPTSQRVFEIVGRDSTKPAKDITIENISVIGSDFSAEWHPGPDNIMLNPQGMIFGENVEGLTVRGCRLLAAGHAAVFLNNYAQNCVVESNMILEAGFVGVYMNGWPIFKGPFKTAQESYVNKGHRIENNFIYDCGKFIGAGCGVQFYQSGDNIVARNEVGEMPRYGISYKGLCYVTFNRGEAFGTKITWDNHWDFIHTRNNKIVGNEIYSVCRNSHDFGAIEAWGVGRDNLWESNAIHDIDAAINWECFGNILYADDHNHYLTMRNNILHHCFGGAVSTAFQMKSVGQVTENCLVADSSLGFMVGMKPFKEPVWGTVVRHNVFASAAKSAVYAVDKSNPRGFFSGKPMPAGEKGIIEIDRNAVTPKGSTPNPAPYPEYGMDLNSYWGDPKLKRAKPLWDIQYTDYSLASDSPALKLGHKPINTSVIGLRKDFPFNKLEATRREATHKIQAEMYQRMHKLRTQGGNGIQNIEKGAWAKYSNINFGSSSPKKAVFEASLGANGIIELRLDSPEGELVGKLDAAGKGACEVKPVSGVHNIYLVFPAGDVKTVDWFRFE